MKPRYTLWIAVVSVMPLAGCNILEGTGRATMNITHGIAEDARAVVNTVKDSDEQTHAQVATGTIQEVNDANSTLLVRVDDEDPIIFTVNEGTVYNVQGEAATRDEALRTDSQVKVVHRSGIALKVDRIS